MLVLSRKHNETIVIDGGIRVTVVSIRGHQIRLGIEAPDHVGIYREELCLPGRDARQHEGPPPAASPCPPVGPAVGPDPSLAEGGYTDEYSEPPRRPLARAVHPGRHAGGSSRKLHPSR